MKRRWLLRLILVVLALSIIAVGIRHGLKKQAQKRREAAYQIALGSFRQVLRPGMTRKEVESYLRAKNTQFRQMCCVEVEELSKRSSWDDLTKIGEEEAPWFCGEKNVYIAFQFADHERHDGMPRADDMDTLRAVTIYRWLENCL